MNRNQTTIEQRAITLRIRPEAIPSPCLTLASKIFFAAPADRSKYMTKAACADYQAALNSQVMDLALLAINERHSRQIVVKGPLTRPPACWTSTQLLTTETGGWEVIGVYRSMDKAHTMEDAAMQLIIAAAILDEADELELITLQIGSYHEYIDGVTHG